MVWVYWLKVFYAPKLISVIKNILGWMIITGHRKTIGLSHMKTYAYISTCARIHFHKWRIGTQVLWGHERQAEVKTYDCLCYCFMSSEILYIPASYHLLWYSHDCEICSKMTLEYFQQIFFHREVCWKCTSQCY